MSSLKKEKRIEKQNDKPDFQVRASDEYKKYLEAQNIADDPPLDHYTMGWAATTDTVGYQVVNLNFSSNFIRFEAGTQSFSFENSI